VRALEEKNLVIPVVGNLAGPTALQAIGKLMAERGDTLSAFYASNVEFYLFLDSKFPKFVDNLSKIPRTPRSLIIRAAFANAYGMPRFVPGYRSASFVDNANDLVDGYAHGRYRDYRELMVSR